MMITLFAVALILGSKWTSAATILDNFQKSEASQLVPTTPSGSSTITDLTSEECGYACMERESPPCWSFSYHEDGWCNLHETSAELGDAALQSASHYTYYERTGVCDGFLDGNTCYSTISGVSQAAATSQCQGSNLGNLVALHSVDKFDSLISKLQNYADTDYWISLIDYMSDRNFFVWPGIKLLAYDRWGSGQPTAAGTGDCVTISSSTGTMSIAECTHTHKALCETNTVQTAIFTKTLSTKLDLPWFDNYTDTSQEECQLLCVNAENQFCRSFNFDGSTCELNSHTPITSPTSFHNKMNIFVRVVCSDSCENGGTQDLESCRCLCPLGYGGKHCERSHICFLPLGMENHGIPDSRITTSSSQTNAESYYGRLNDKRTPFKGWVADNADASPWLQVDLGELTVVTAIGTQGTGDIGAELRPTSYKLQYSLDNIMFQTYQHNAIDKVFVGNYAGNKLLIHELETFLITRYVRILIAGGDHTLRAELYGCPSNNLAAFKSVHQSSEQAGAAAANAVDDTPDSCTSLYHNDSPWWVVDTGDAYGIIAVAMVTNGNQGEPLSGTEIRVGMNDQSSFNQNQLCSSMTLKDWENNDQYILRHCGDSINGRYVSMQLPSTGMLSVCEVLVYAEKHPCGIGGIYKNNRCYAMYESLDDARTFGGAMVSCYAERWGSLVNIENLEEFEWLSALSGGRSFLTGLSRSPSQNAYTWTDGNPVGYVKWGLGEPTNGDCVLIESDYSSVECSELNMFICEYQPGDTTRISKASPMIQIASSLDELGDTLGFDTSSFVVKLVNDKLVESYESEDVIFAVRILGTIMEYAAMDANATEKFLSIINIILDKSNVDLFQEALLAVPTLASDIMTMMEEFAYMVCTYQITAPGENQYFYDNFVMYIRAIPSGFDGDLTYSVDVDQRDIQVKVARETFSSMEVKFTAISYYTVTEVMFTNFEDVVGNMPEIGSDIISLSLHSTSGEVQLSDENPVHIQFSHNKKMEENEEAQCAFWSLNDSRTNGGIWSYDGCRTNESNSNENVTQCICDHMTSFATLMQIVDFENNGHLDVLNYISYIGGILSMICLVLTLACYGFLRLYGSQRIVIHANLSLALLVALTMTLFGLDAESPMLCKAIAIMIHYAWLSVFMWMLIEGIQLYVKSNAAFSKGVRTWIFVIFGWGVPLFIVALTLGIQFDTYENPKSCWLSIEHGTIWAFVGPAIAVITLNGIVMVMVIRILMSLKANTDKTELQRIKAGVRAVLILQPLLGITWMFGLFSVSSQTVMFQYLFVVFNSLQGMFIFTLQCVTNDEVRKAFTLKRKKLSSTLGVTSFGTSSSNTESSLVDKSKVGTISRTASASSTSTRKAWL